MKKYEKKIAKSQLDAEKKTLRELKQVYKKAQEDVEKSILEIGSRTDMEHVQQILYQTQFQAGIKTQIDKSLKDLDSKSYDTIHDFLQDSYVNGYVGNRYVLQQQTGCTLCEPIDQKKVIRALQTNSKLSARYYKADPLKGRLAEDLDKLKTSVRAELSRGVLTGKTWKEIAFRVAKGMNNPLDKALNDAMRIARTEGHRVNQEGFLDAGDEAKKKGADIVKQWDATLDSKTRPWHQEADGQIREWDEDFIVNGEHMKAPSVGGSASNVCNCRCQLLQRARWMLNEAELQTLKDRASFFGLDKTSSFEDFKDKYLKLPKDADTKIVPPANFFHDITGTTTKIKGTMSASDYDELMQMLSKNPDLAELYDLADDIGKVTRKKGGGCCWGSSGLEWDFPDASYQKKGMSKFRTLCHEYGHFFDTRSFDGLTFEEMDGLNQVLNRRHGRIVASSSDQFLSAMRKDAKSITKDIKTVKEYCNKHYNTSVGVQDAVDGLGLGRIGWGHGDKYYNRFYNSYVKDSRGWVNKSKETKEFLESRGFDASNQAKVKKIVRHYETASELWANIASAVACGGEELESMKKMFPEATKEFLEIIKKVKKP